MTEFTTSDGVVLSVGRVSRHSLDSVVLSLVKPEPPVREITVWDGSTETVQITDDPDYLNELAKYYLQLKQHQFEILETAVSVKNRASVHDQDEYDALIAIGILDEQRPLQAVLELKDDAIGVIDLIFYNSTVTQRGIDEANRKIGAYWEQMPLSSYKFKEQFPVNVSQYFIDRMTALHFGFKWNEFCELWGWEQSEYVALYSAQNSLEYMKSRHK